MFDFLAEEISKFEMESTQPNGFENARTSN